MVSNIVVLAYSLVFATGKISTFIAFFIEFNQIRVETGNTMPLFLVCSVAMENMARGSHHNQNSGCAKCKC